MREEPIQLRGHHLSMLGEFFHGRNIDCFISKYGKEFIEFIKKAYLKILNKEYPTIEIVDGPDTFCNSLNPACQCKDNCKSMLSIPEDAEYISEYKLKLGENSINKILDKITNYKTVTGFSSPRTEKYFMLDEFFTLSK